MSISAKLFMSGRSQAIRLPAKLRLDAKEVRIEQIGRALWVQPEVLPSQSMAGWLQDFYATSDPLPETFLSLRDDSASQVRDWS